MATTRTTLVPWLQIMLGRRLSTCCPVLAEKPVRTKRKVPAKKPIKVPAKKPIKDKVPAKRPANVFSLFIKEKYHDPELEGKDKLKTLAQKWNNLPLTSKQPYNDRYIKAMAEYKAITAADCPPPRRRHLTGYNLFMKEGLISDLMKEKDRTERFALISKQWSGLSEQQKKEYNDRAKEINKSSILDGKKSTSNSDGEEQDTSDSSDGEEGASN